LDRLVGGKNVGKKFSNHAELQDDIQSFPTHVEMPVENPAAEMEAKE
jgi:hypothetical protein